MEKIFLIFILYFICALVAYIFITYDNIRNYKKDKKLREKYKSVQEFLEGELFGIIILSILWPVSLIAYIIFFTTSKINKYILEPIINKFIE
jgi:uncharacterized membrane protein